MNVAAKSRARNRAPARKARPADTASSPPAYPQHLTPPEVQRSNIRGLVQEACEGIETGLAMLELLQEVADVELDKRLVVRCRRALAGAWNNLDVLPGHVEELVQVLGGGGGGAGPQGARALEVEREQG